jgi:DNA invertase Pin-like site-specific DNA recombinase
MPAYGYTRVSTAQQASQGLSLAEQQRQITSYTELHTLGVAKIFVEKGISGSVPFRERPQGKALLAQLQPGDTVVAAKLDRMFRDTLDANETAHLLDGRQVGLHLLDLPGGGTNGALGRMLLTIMAAVAEFERARIAERIAEGKAQQRIDKTFLGGERQFGYATTEKGPLVEDPAEQAVIVEIIASHRDGASLRIIQGDLNRRGIKISRGTIANIVNRHKDNRDGDGK